MAKEKSEEQKKVTNNPSSAKSAQQRILEKHVRNLESIPDQVARQKQDVLDVYGSRVQHFDDAGTDIKKLTQNLIRPDTMYDPPEGWTQDQIVALNVLTALSMGDVHNPDMCVGKMDYQKETGKHLLSRGIDLTMIGLGFTYSELINNLVIRRPNALYNNKTGSKILNPARVKMKKALDAYINKKDPKPLGEIFGETLTAYAGFNKLGKVAGGLVVYSGIAETVCKLLGDHPALKESARSFGLTDATMATLSTEAALGGYYLNSIQAEKRITSGEELSKEQFYDSMTDLVMGALVAQCTNECAQANEKKKDQIYWQLEQKAQPLDRRMAPAAMYVFANESQLLAEAQTPGTKRYQKLSDPNLKQRIREAVEKNETINELRSNPEKLDEFRLALGNLTTLLDRDPNAKSKEFEKNWLPLIRDPFLPVLDSGVILEERSPDVKCREAEKLLHTTRDKLEEQAKKHKIPLSDYIDQKETEKIWKERKTEQAWMRRAAGLLGMAREQLIAKAYGDNMTVREKVEQYKQEIRKTAQRCGMSEEQFIRTAEEKHTDTLTLSDRMNEEYILSTAEKFNVSREQMQEMANRASEGGAQKTVLDIADALVEEGQRAERAYDEQVFDKQTRKLAESADLSENVKQLLQLAKVVHSDVMEALRSGQENSPVMKQLKIPQNVSLDVLALCERVIADREKNGNRPGKLEKLIENDGFPDVIMRIHQHKPEAQTKARSALTVEKLRNAVKDKNIGGLLGIGKGAAALEKAAGVPKKPLNQAQKII